jgi:paraquat-inducible protein A
MAAALTQSLIACHECDLLQRKTAARANGTVKCRRCGSVLYRNKRNSLDHTLALTVGAMIVLIVTNVFPILGLQAGGDRTSATLFGTAWALHEMHMTSVAVLVLVTTLLVPALQLGVTLYMLVPLKLGRVPHGLSPIFRLRQSIRPWSIVEVYLLGIIVALAKAAHSATVVPGIALWSFGALVVLLAASAASFNTEDFWARVAACQTRVRRLGTTVAAADREQHDHGAASLS